MKKSSAKKSIIEAKSKPKSYHRGQKQWNIKNKLLTITYPIKVLKSEGKTRKFKIIIFYQDQQGHQHHKKICFGLVGIKNKIDGGVERTKRIQRTNLFHPYYWQKLLLDSHQSLQKAFQMAIKQLEIK